GGFDNSNGAPFAGVQTYNPTMDTWTAVTPLNIAKSFAFTGTIGTTIVAAAGSVGNGPTLDNEVYDPATNTWTTKSSARLGRYGGCAGAIGGALYAAGGLKFSPIRGASDHLDVYHLAADHWRALARMPFAEIGP